MRETGATRQVMSVISALNDEAWNGQHGVQVIVHRACAGARRPPTAVHVDRAVQRQLVAVVVVGDGIVAADSDPESWHRQDAPRGAL